MSKEKQLEREIRHLRFSRRKALRKHEKWKFISLMLFLFILLLLFAKGFNVGC
jgi:hypothetical protein